LSIDDRIKGFVNKLQQVLGVNQVEALAISTSFSKRKSKLPVIAFLKMLLFDHLRADLPSLQQHSFELVCHGEAKVSKQAIAKKFTDNTVDFIKTLFERYLRYQLAPVGLPSALSDHFSAIRIMDATSYKIPANLSADFPGFSGSGTAACAKLQFEYELLEGKILELEVQTVRVSDKTFASQRIGTLGAGELIIRDLGYYSVELYHHIERQRAFYVSRLQPQVAVYEKKNGQYIPLRYGKIIRHLKTTGQKYMDIEVYIGNTAKKRVRLIANLLDGQAVERRVQRKKHHKRQLSATDRQLCQLNLFITNVPGQSLGADAIYKLYKIRWQVELVFKGWKGILKINITRKMNTARFKCYLYSKLLWILLSWDMCNIASAGLCRHQQLVGIYKCIAMIKQQAHTIRVLLFGHAAKLRRYFKNLYGLLGQYGVKEKRKNRESLVDLLQLKQPGLL
jgi:Transposase DDE domain